ncbi:hypothetical protein KIN20_031737 [Parelaphostrongylus tenuis]|uniref:Deacetylase sirtuin-type domain-containing protein n=1 Tax=Parelaphostrongylus tenuis TaxID=148309 RepID=A0AAD5WHY4_PARTN|nr:hypothetical protein KIN20_031737 [Parelaphostrongylus tenuis]
MTSRFVPTFKAPSSDVVKKFIDKVAAIDRLLVLTGAGISTESGYRMTIKDMVKSHPQTVTE